MYMPPQFSSRDPDFAARLMREHPFASLVSTDDDGFPFVTHLPLHLQRRENTPAQEKHWVLWGHVAKPNPHWRYLRDRPEALVTFVGPHAYLSPSVYPDLARVPSWNYLAVHCRVTARLIEAADEKDAVLKMLIGDHEPEYAAQWRAFDPDFAHKMLAGIAAFELSVVDWQCKLKLNQHRPECHDSLYRQYTQGNASERGLAEWMQRLGMAADHPDGPART